MEENRNSRIFFLIWLLTGKSSYARTILSSHRILFLQTGLEYCCATYDRFNSLNTTFKQVLDYIINFFENLFLRKDHDRLPTDEGNINTTFKLLNLIIKCYRRLCDNERAKKALDLTLPKSIDLQYSECEYDENRVMRVVDCNSNPFLKIGHELNNGGFYVRDKKSGLKNIAATEEALILLKSFMPEQRTDPENQAGGQERGGGGQR